MTVTGTEPVVPVPLTSAGAATATGRSATGSRTTTGPFRVTKPLANLVSGAVVRVNVSSAVCVEPAASNVRLDVPVTSKPGTSTFRA